MAEESQVKEVRCFQHCSRQWNILCFNVPLICPLCQQDVTTTPMRIPPFLIDSPFTCAQSSRCSILIKPTEGSFLHEFCNNSNLHIGVTSSSCCVVEFDEKGVTVGDSSWTQCLSIDVVKSQDSAVLGDWDRKLEEVVRDPRWRKESYDEESNNCYDFVTQFLQKCPIIVDEFQCVLDRSAFCREMVVPVTHKAGQYISLYRDIVRQGYVLQQAK